MAVRSNWIFTYRFTGLCISDVHKTVKSFAKQQTPWTEILEKQTAFQLFKKFSGLFASRTSVRPISPAAHIPITKQSTLFSPDRLQDTFFSQGIRRPERDTDHTRPPSSEVKNKWSYTCTSPRRLYIKYWHTFTFLPTFSIFIFHFYLKPYKRFSSVTPFTKYKS